MSTLTEEELESAAALFRARVAQQNAASYIDPTAAALLRHHDAALMDAWVGQQHAQHMQHMAAQHAAVRALSAARRATFEMEGLRSIPLGFFRDPEGKTWAANLEHPGGADSATAGEGRDPNGSAGASSRAATKAKNKLAREEVIELSSDSEEEEPSQPSPLPRIAQQPTHQETAKRKVLDMPGVSTPTEKDKAIARIQHLQEELLPRTTHTHPQAQDTGNAKQPEKIPFFLKKLTEAAKRAPGTYQTHPAPRPVKRHKTSAAADSTPLQQPNQLLYQAPGPTEQEMRERHERARKIVADAEVEASASKPEPDNHQENQEQGDEPFKLGKFVQRWLAGTVDSADQDRLLSSCIDKVLMATTGYTKATAPESLPFPPNKITLDMEQLEEVAMDMMQERHSAITDAVRTTFQQMIARHEERMAGMKKSTEEHSVQEMFSMKNRLDQALREASKAEQTISKLKNEIAMIQKEADEAKEEAADAMKSQSKSLETMMKASILSLRMIRKNERQ